MIFVCVSRVLLFVPRLINRFEYEIRPDVARPEGISVSVLNVRLKD